MMNKNFNPRTREEIMRALKNLKSEQTEWHKESDKRLEERLHQLVWTA
ncbi:MAG: hypothetical protein IJ635_08020 [Bacteroidaceae bacterium]|nr:hypothetical protein [Bacteroidaceae bacterium]MBR1521169.1 hypothetical protein [Bacteroidaceae bacterium]